MRNLGSKGQKLVSVSSTVTLITIHQTPAPKNLAISRRRYMIVSSLQPSVISPRLYISHAFNLEHKEASVPDLAPCHRLLQTETDVDI